MCLAGSVERPANLSCISYDERQSTPFNEPPYNRQTDSLGPSGSCTHAFVLWPSSFWGDWAPTPSSYSDLRATLPKGRFPRFPRPSAAFKSWKKGIVERRVSPVSWREPLAERQSLEGKFFGGSRFDRTWQRDFRVNSRAPSVFLSRWALAPSSGSGALVRRPSLPVLGQH